MAFLSNILSKHLYLEKTFNHLYEKLQLKIHVLTWYLVFDIWEHTCENAVPVFCFPIKQPLLSNFRANGAKRT